MTLGSLEPSRRALVRERLAAGLHIFEDQGDDFLEVTEGFVGIVSLGGQAFKSRAVDQIRLAAHREADLLRGRLGRICIGSITCDLRQGLWADLNSNSHCFDLCGRSCLPWWEKADYLTWLFSS